MFNFFFHSSLPKIKSYNKNHVKEIYLNKVSMKKIPYINV